jgi:hypothetical protein
MHNSLLVMQTRFAYMPQQAMTLTKNGPVDGGRSPSREWFQAAVSGAILSF